MYILITDTVFVNGVFVLYTIDSTLFPEAALKNTTSQWADTGV